VGKKIKKIKKIKYKTHQHKPPTQWNNTYNIHKYMGSNAMESSYPKNSSKKKGEK
jgi:hypothetical protein